MPRSSMPADGDTASRVLDIASRLVQTRGFNGFSYADIAAELQVTKASLHYHFPTKAELGRRLIERYESRFVAALAAIDGAARDAPAKLRRYIRIYAGVLQERQMCLCGMLAAEHGTLPEPMRGVLQHYFDANEHWLARVLDEGRREGELMLARSYGDTSRFDAAAERLLADLRPAPRAISSRAPRPSARARR
jgi:TetR/AcrR family transcriptional regulator, transcriptional repressor for nem operon